MKKLIVASTLIVLVAACHKKTMPTITTRTEQPPPPAKPVVPVAVATDVEAGKAIYTTQCARCHSPKPVDNWTVEEWQPILRSMIPRARLNEAQRAQLTAYVTANAKK